MSLLLYVFVAYAACRSALELIVLQSHQNLTLNSNILDLLHDKMAKIVQISSHVSSSDLKVRIIVH